MCPTTRGRRRRSPPSAVKPEGEKRRGRGLAGRLLGAACRRVQKLLKAKGAKVSRESVAATGHRLLVDRHERRKRRERRRLRDPDRLSGPDMSQQLREQGKKAVVFGTDGVYSPSQYQAATGLRLRVRGRSALPEKCEEDCRRVQQVLEEQGVRCLRSAKLRGCMGRNVCDPEGLRRRHGDSGRAGPRTSRSRTLPSILGGSVQFDRRGRSHAHRVRDLQGHERHVLAGRLGRSSDSSGPSLAGGPLV